MGVPDASLDDLSAELILRILAHLSDVRDVVHVSQASRRLQRLATDALLWKRLFVHDFLLQESSGSTRRQSDDAHRTKRRRGDTADTLDSRGVSRHVRHLPRIARSSLRSLSEADLQADTEDGKLDWHALYRISSNWQTGKFDAHDLVVTGTAEEEASSLSSTAGAATSIEKGKRKQLDDARQYESPYFADTLVTSRGNVIFTASRRTQTAAPQGIIYAFASAQGQESAPESRAQTPLASFVSPAQKKRHPLVNAMPAITSLTVDKADLTGPTHRLVATYADGTISLFSFDESSAQFEELTFQHTTGLPQRVVTSAFHWPYLATCTVTFDIRVFLLSADCNLRLIDERKSHSCHWPACLRIDNLTTAPTSAPSARLSIAFTLPMYPRGWTIGLQEILYCDANVTTTRSASARRSYVSTRLDAKAAPSRTAMQPVDVRMQATSRLMSLSYEHPYIVVGSQDNDVACFRVDGVAHDATLPAHDILRIAYLQTLYGHTGSVHSVSLNGGRCVTGGGDGSVRVWRLGDEELSIARATGLLATLDGRLRRGLGKVVSLRADEESTATTRKRRKRDAGVDGADDEKLSLASIVRRVRLSKSRTASAPSLSSSPMHSAIRWVSSTFDRIISVSAITPSIHPITLDLGPPSTSTCRVDARTEEQVQVWSFAA